ncbi:nitroreductase [Planktotalea arctica]|uniref:nitroreductase n=1 Tax=Planktotalea arctica TaxID=1481893 RepID=UPI00321A756A
MSEIDTLETLLKRRHSCRAFLDTPVERAVIERITRTAGRVPSWCNAQPWNVTVTDTAETERFQLALGEHIKIAAPQPDLPFPTSYSGAHQARRRECGFQLYDAVGIEKGDRDAAGAQMMQNFTFFGAPHVALITSSAELGPYGAMDCGGFVSTFCLAADALGVATVPQAAIASYAPFVRSHFGIGEDRLLLCAISLGLEDKAHPANSFRTARAQLGEFFEWKDAP